MRSIFVLPGEIWFGPGPARIHTLLGSCLAVCVWHPQRKLGGLCHFLLPSSGFKRSPQVIGQALNPRYGDEALQAMLEFMQDANTHPQEYQYKLFGAGTFMTLPDTPRRHTAFATQRLPVGEQNIAAAHAWLHALGVSAKVEDVGRPESRRIVLDLSTGTVWVHYARNNPPAPTMING